MKDEEKKDDKQRIAFTMVDLDNIIFIISTHPTPEGVGSPQGQTKMILVNKCREIREQLNKT